MMDIVRLGLFNEQDNSLSVVDRTLRIWQEMAEGQIRAPLRASPRELLKEALGGVEFEDFFALGIRLWSLALKRDPLSGEQAMTINRHRLGNGLSADVVDEFLRRVAAPPEWYRSKFASPRSTYDFLAFQERPVMWVGDELLVLDDTYLLEKFTSSGLFWAVHDNERDRHGDGHRKRWNEAHGEFIERLVTGRLQNIAPADQATDSGLAFYSEDELKATYPSSKVVDGVVDYGDYLLAVEVTGGQTVLDTRVSGDPDKFEADTNKLVLNKVKQLHGLCRSLLDDQSRLTGYTPSPQRKIVPVLVVGGGYPADALSRSHVEDKLAEEGLLQDDALLPLCILDPTEVEILETLQDSGKSPAWVLAAWKRSGLRNVGFKNYVVKEVDPDLPTPVSHRKRAAIAYGAAAERLAGEPLPEGALQRALTDLED